MEEAGGRPAPSRKRRKRIMTGKARDVNKRLLCFVEKQTLP